MPHHASSQRAPALALTVHYAPSGALCLLAALNDMSLAVLQAPDSTAGSWAQAAEAGSHMLCATRGFHGAPWCSDAAVGDLQGMGRPQVYAAAGNGVHVLLGSTAVTTHSRSSEGGSMPTGMWGATCTAMSPPMPLAVLSFLNGTRIMAVHGAGQHRIHRSCVHRHNINAHAHVINRVPQGRSCLMSRLT